MTRFKMITRYILVLIHSE